MENETQDKHPKKDKPIRCAVRETQPRFRFRYVYMVFFTLVGLILLAALDPDVGLINELRYGAGFIATLADTFKVFLYIALYHYSRKALFDYIDLSPWFERAYQTSTGAGLGLIAIGLHGIAVALIITKVM